METINEHPGKGVWRRDDLSGFEVTLSPLLILLRRGLILTLHTQEAKRFHHIRRYAETYLHGLPKNMEQVDKLTLVLLRIIDESNSQDFERLQEIEETADKLSEDLSNVKAPRALLGNRIYRMKHALIVYLSGLWATADALSELLRRRRPHSQRREGAHEDHTPRGAGALPDQHG